MQSMSFRGQIAYPLTPFKPGGAVDLDSLEALVARLARSGVDGIVVLGSSGSFAYLEDVERGEVVQTAVQAAAGSGTPVGAGISSMTTQQVLRLAHDAENNGADGLVLNPLSYLPLVAQEIADQVETVASNVSLPLCLYNNPMTTGFDYPVDLAADLSWLEPVVAFKDTATNAQVFHNRRAMFAAQAEPGTAHGFSGEQAIASWAPPADAWHTGLGALLPVEMSAYWKAAITGDAEQVRSWQRLLAPLMEVLRYERPLSSLYALAQVCGVETAAPRRPLLPIPSQSRQRLADAVAVLREERESLAG